MKRICICATQVPFVRGGAEALVEGLHRALAERGFVVDVVALPFKWYPKTEIVKSALAWRLLDLSESNGQRIDLVIATKFPSYAVRHGNKVVWLVHQHRQAYDWYGTPFSDFTNTPGDNRIREIIAAIDRHTLREAKRIFTISKNVAVRLKRFNELDGIPLYPPPRLDGRFRSGDYGDYVFTVGRLDAAKRFDLLVQAMRESRSRARCLIAGTGPEHEKLAKLVTKLGISDRVQLLGYVDDARLIDLYAGAFAVYYAPIDEDYGYTAVEAFQSERPVVTTSDAGGVLEFVVDGETGHVVPTEPREIAAAIDALATDEAACARLGRAGRQVVRDIRWETVVDKLTS